MSDTKPNTADFGYAVGKSISALQDKYLGNRTDIDRAKARAVLATLRNVAGINPEQNIVAWQRVLETVVPDLDEEFLGKNEPSNFETVAFNMFALFARHIQSKDVKMHLQNVSFATAVGELIKKSSSNSLELRFKALMAAKDEKIRLQHLKGLISLMRAANIGFDYGMLAKDSFQLTTTYRTKILLRWGRDFAISISENAKQETDSETSN